MPPIHNQKRIQKSTEQEGLKEQAIRDLKSSKISSICKAATLYGIPFGSLKDRHNGVLPKAISNAQKRKLNTTEEEVLIQRILSLDKQGFPPRPAAI